jgi:AhpD family alkylhydroperoxidase
MSKHTRVDYDEFRKTAPAANAALVAVGKAVDDSGLEKALTELIKVRASQRNGCAFCVQYHLNGARKAGIAPEKLDLVAAWGDAGIFSERERAALAWTEALTEHAAHGASDDAYAAVRKQFTEPEVVFLTVAVGMINSWNRIAGALRFSPPIPRRAASAA